jgi:hypothetical protein
MPLSIDKYKPGELEESRVPAKILFPFAANAVTFRLFKEV